MLSVYRFQTAMKTVLAGAMQSEPNKQINKANPSIYSRTSALGQSAVKPLQPKRCKLAFDPVFCVTATAWAQLTGFSR